MLLSVHQWDIDLISFCNVSCVAKLFKVAEHSFDYMSFVRVLCAKYSSLEAETSQKENRVMGDLYWRLILALLTVSMTMRVIENNPKISLL